jgi:small GTP-binding protein
MYADEIQRKIEAVKKEIHDTPYDKSSQFHHGVLKAKLARYNDMLEAKKTSGSGGGVGYAIKHSGDASVVLVGLPSVGKSTLLNAVTNAVSKIGNYDFTTLGVVPGMMEYKGVRIQILDLPGIIEGAAKGKGFGRKVLSVVRASDLVVLMADYKRSEWILGIKNEMEESGVRLNKRPPKMHVSKMGKGGIQIIDPYKTLPEEMMIEVAKEMGLDNAVIQVGEKLESIDVFIDGLSKSRTYIPLVEVVTKVDEIKKPKKFEGAVMMSAQSGIGIDEFKEKVWQGLGRVRVYLKKERTGESDFNEPLIMKRGQRLRDVAKRISSQLRDDINRAYIWGKGARFPGQEVSLHYEVFDEMEVWFSR